MHRIRTYGEGKIKVATSQSRFTWKVATKMVCVCVCVSSVLINDILIIFGCWMLCFSGFAFIRPTSSSVRLYETTWDLYVKYHKAHDQVYLNLAIDRLNGDNRRAPLVRIHSLSRSLFPYGAYYFEHEHRMFENKPPCPECVMVHNNYMGSIAAKVLYRDLLDPLI